MTLHRTIVLAALASGALVPLATVGQAAEVTTAKSLACAANTSCKLVFTDFSNVYYDTLSCQWSNPKVNLVQIATVESGTTIMAIPYALTSEERLARGMYRSDPTLTVTSSQQLQVTFQASNASANSVTCYALGYTIN